MLSDMSLLLNRKRKADCTQINSSAPISIAIKGQDLSYTYLAAEKFIQNFSMPAEVVSTASIQDVFDKVSREECSYGLMPLESSSFGTIHTVYDRLLASNGQLQIVGELGQIEQHCLCVKGTTDVGELDVERVVSHPHILECCSEYLKMLDIRRQGLQRAPVERIASWDSAAGCESVATNDDNGTIRAAICSKEAAEKHGLKVLVDAIGNDRNAEVHILLFIEIFSICFVIIE
jgi:chorismate mutase/prephenate dehydratase